MVQKLERGSEPEFQEWNGVSQERDSRVRPRDRGSLVAQRGKRIRSDEEICHEARSIEREEQANENATSA